MQDTLKVEQPRETKQQFWYFDQDIVGFVNLNIFKFPPPLHKIWQEEGQTKSPCHDQLWISRPASKCRLTQSTSNIKYIHPIQIHSSNIKYIQKIQTKMITVYCFWAIGQQCYQVYISCKWLSYAVPDMIGFIVATNFVRLCLCLCFFVICAT